MKVILVIAIAVVLTDAGIENGAVSHVPVTPYGVKYEAGNLDQDKTISYSITYDDYLYLQRHKTEGRDSPYNPEHGPEDGHRDSAGFDGNFNGDVTVFKNNLSPHYHFIHK